MSVNKLSLNKMMKNKDASKELTQAITGAYIDSSVDEVRKTLGSMADKESLNTVRGNAEDSWLSMLVYSLIYSTKAVGTLIENIDPKNAGYYIGAFGDNTMVSVAENSTMRSMDNGSVSINVTISPEYQEGDEKAERLAKSLAATFYGGEYTIGVDHTEEGEGEEKKVIINAQPGFYDKNMVGAEERLVEHFKDRLFDNLSADLESKINKELSKYKG